MPVHPVTVPIALRAGQLDGQMTTAGSRIALADLLIGLTALELGYSVATGNLRHFQMIPGLISGVAALKSKRHARSQPKKSAVACRRRRPLAQI
ncbi:MAG TPA: hypothetical protein VHW09_10570 [Bryobacteraceae bacterium]|jgi:predicted nucleic acid-binding protein|nr:hypothetical protein [Bryobacteraceae bacterium]